MVFTPIENPSQELLDDLLKQCSKGHCPDCAAPPDTPHIEGCDVARCLNTGGQRLVCSCGRCGKDVWDGYWPGTKEAYKKKYVVHDSCTDSIMFDFNRVVAESRCKGKPKKPDQGERKIKFKKG